MDIAEALRRLAAPFFAQGVTTLHVAACPGCRRVFVGVAAPERCKGCKQGVITATATTLEEVVWLAPSLRL